MKKSPHDSLKRKKKLSMHRFRKKPKNERKNQCSNRGIEKEPFFIFQQFENLNYMYPKTVKDIVLTDLTKKKFNQCISFSFALYANSKMLSRALVNGPKVNLRT